MRMTPGMGLRLATLLVALRWPSSQCFVQGPWREAAHQRRGPRVGVVTRPRHMFVRHASPPRPSPSDADNTAPPATLEEVVLAGAHWGCKMDMYTFGPSYRIEMRKTPWRRVEKDGTLMYVHYVTGEACQAMPRDLEFTRSIGSPLADTDDVLMTEEPDLIGYTNGFVQPGGVLHLDTMQVRRFSGYWLRKRGVKPTGCETPNPGVLGLGLILGGVAGCFGQEWGCTRAELLAIYDEDRQHQILVRYYERLGFKQVRQVGDSLESIGDRLVWGGVGTLMEAEVEPWLRKFGPIMRDPGCGLL